MHLDVSKALVAEGTDIPFSVEVPLSDTEVLSEAVFYPALAVLTGHYTSLDESMQVCGEMRFAAVSRCARCLADAKKTYSVPFDVVFTLTPNPDNPDLYLYDGAWIDLADLAADTAQLALPMQWLCDEDCKGLCPVCGTDRNLLLCSCRIEGNEKHPFSALQQLLTEDESEV